MQTHSKEKLMASYRKAYAAIPQESLDLDLRVTVKTMQALAEGNPIPPEQLARLWDLPLEQVHIILEQADARGQIQLDGKGNLIGGVLSLVPTRHRIVFDEIALYAWCAFDAIFAPGVIGKTAKIESKDPVTGEPIELTITRSGIGSIRPESAVVSILSGDGDLRGGPDTPRCTQQLFFASRQSAERWLGDQPGVGILGIGEAFEIAMAFQIEPAQRLGLISEEQPPTGG